MSGEFTHAASYEYVTLVDRAMTGGCEIIHDGVRVVFKRGEMERTVPLFLAQWLFQTDKERVHTTDGQYVRRFGLKNPPPELLAEVGPECADCDPIAIDSKRIERWNVEAYAPDRGRTREIPVARRPEDFTNLAAETATFSRER